MLRALGCLLVLSLTACDGAEQPLLVSEPTPLLPLAVGNAWPALHFWDLVDEARPDRTTSDTLVVVASVEIDGETWYEIRGTGAATERYFEGYYTNRADGVYRRTPGYGPSTESSPTMAYKYPVEAGDTHEAFDMGVTVIGGAYPVDWDFGFYRAVVYEFVPDDETVAWSGFPLEDGAGVHRSRLIPGIGFADVRIAWLSAAGSTDGSRTDFAESGYILTGLPTLYDVDTPSAVPASAWARAQRGADLGAQAGLLVGGEAAPVPVGQRPIERPE